MKLNQCIGVIGWFFGHKFQARYSISEKQNNAMATLRTAESVPAYLFEPLSDKQYHHDVCTRCGQIIRDSIPLQ